MDTAVAVRRRLIGGAAAVALLAVGAVGLVRAQQPAEPAAPPTVTAPPQPDIVPPDETVPSAPEAAAPAVAGEKPDAAATPAQKPPPVAAVTMGGQPVVEPGDEQPLPAPPAPIRSPVAVIQALDKVTAETMRFAVPVNRRVRYKNLIFQARSCETTGLTDPQPQHTAYLVIESQPRETVGRAPPIKQVYKGWMYASSPGLHPLEHPVYDAWLVACSAGA